jgi:heme-degrading monooxygenase HmoA
MIETSPEAKDATAVTACTAFAALSRFTVANGMEDAVKRAFRARPHLVDDVEGFVRMEVISPRDKPQELWLLTFWTDEHAFDEWHHGHLYHESHRGIPKGLKLVPRSTELLRFEHVCS